MEARILKNDADAHRLERLTIDMRYFVAECGEPRIVRVIGPVVDILAAVVEELRRERGVRAA